ncbi:MAG TPA: DedA family protein [bacterium]|nr:DedA family protein [bacterium]HPN33751.1 DedA family protein [bacterium]
MITEIISQYAVKILEAMGYWGAGLLMALESMIAPVPSEAVMPFVGFLVADGKWSLWASLLSTSLGSIVGSLISYYLGYYGGKPLVLKVGKYLLLDRHDLEMTENFFNKRSGVWTLFISRFIPVIRHFISIPAGIGRMPIGSFVIATVIGATLWNGFLLYLGLKLRENWQVVQKYSHQIDIGVVLFLVVLLGWFVHSRLQKRKALQS